MILIFMGQSLLAVGATCSITGQTKGTGQHESHAMAMLPMDDVDHSAHMNGASDSKEAAFNCCGDDNSCSMNGCMLPMLLSAVDSIPENTLSSGRMSGYTPTFIDPISHFLYRPPISR